MTDSMPFTPYIVSPSSLVQSYASASNHASGSAVPSVPDLMILDIELKSIQSDLEDRRAKLRADEDKLKHWKAKGKERATPHPPLPSFNGINGHHNAAADNKAIQKVIRDIRESSVSSSPDPSETDSSIVRVKRSENKKRKRKRVAIADSDGDYSETEAGDLPMPHEPKSRKTLPQPPPIPSVPPQLAPPLSHVKQKTASPAPAPSPGGTPIPSAPSIKLKLSGLGSKSSLSGTPPPSQAAISVMPSFRKGIPGVADNFSLPTRTMVPPKPASVPPVPLPKTQQDVTEDFSKVKVGAQTPFATFQNYLEPYLRNFTEEDLAWLAQKSDDLTPFLIPALGRHYADWSIDDSNHASALDPPPLDRFRAEDISDERLPTENVYMGPLAERLIAAMTTSVLDVAGEEPSTNGDIDMSQEIPGLGAPPAPASESAQPAPSDDAPPLDAIDLEERLRRELRFLGVFPANPQGQPGNRAKDGDVDWSSRTDDEISAELKACQRLLSEQISVNDATKARLAERVKDRMARQEYEAMRDSLEKTIESGYLKRQRTLAKRKAAATAAQTAPPPASRAGSPAKAAEPVETSDKLPPISAELAQAMYRRQKLIEGVYQLVFANAEPGRFMGMPEG